MLEYLKPFRKQIQTLILTLGFLAAVDFTIAGYLMIIFRPAVPDFNNKFSSLPSFNNFEIFIAVFMILGILILPLVLLEKEFRRHDLLFALKNRK